MQIKDTIYEVFYDDIYNADMKIEFIENRYPFVEATKKTILNNFRKVAILESKFDKDLSLFSIKDIQEVAEVLGYASTNAIQSAISYFSAYTDWCIDTAKRGKNENGVNDFAIFLATHDMSKYVSKFKVKNRYLTKEEIYDAVDNLVNFSDKAIFLSLYEGIGGEKLHELTSMVIENVNFDANKVILTDINGDERLKNISDKLKYILSYANTQNEYLRGNGTVTSIRTKSLFADSPYIIKTLDRNNNAGKMMKYSTLSQKVVTLKKYIGYDFITPKSLEDSGAINRVLELTEERGLDIPNDDIFDILQLPEEYNYSNMQIYSLKQKFHLATNIKDFK